MNIKIIQERLNTYECQTTQEAEFALKEITQELILHALSNAGFFKISAFQGGTCLRILHGLSRFSEDLDFSLQQPDLEFELTPFLNAIKDELDAFGYEIRIHSKGKTTSNVRNAFVKDDTITRLLQLNYPSGTTQARTLNIKLEVDTNPPEGGRFEIKFPSFPIHYVVITHDMPTLFAGKMNALLTRPYIKGRDWFDFLWYVSRQITPNLDFLSNALNQIGPWKNKHPKVDKIWCQKEFTSKIKTIDWEYAKSDVRNFLRSSDQKSLELWNADFFLEQAQTIF